jgi:superfamily II DNA/RNA helicase
MGGPTGSGKTLAYLLPIFDHIKKSEEEQNTIFRLPNRPKAIILAPSKELIQQIYDMAKEVSHYSKLKIGTKEFYTTKVYTC